MEAKQKKLDDIDSYNPEHRVTSYSCDEDVRPGYSRITITVEFPTDELPWLWDGAMLIKLVHDTLKKVMNRWPDGIE